MGAVIAILQRLWALIPVLWRLFGLFRKFKRAAKILSGDYPVVTVNSVLAVSDDCKCRGDKDG